MRFKKYGLYLAWVLSCIGLLGSLYFSEMRHFHPCILCWWQRIALYPLVLILGIAAFRGFTGIVPFVLPQVIFGLVVALYQIAIQEIPGWNPIDICGAGPSCSEKQDIGLGPITIPMLSAANFVVILALLLVSWSSLKKSSQVSENEYSQSLD